MGGNRVASSGVAAVDGSEAPNIVDLFSGVGGLSLGSARAGFVVRGAVDNDPRVNDAHKRNFPNTLHLNTDIAKLTGAELKCRLQFNSDSIAGILGGPPCQGFSAIGRRDKNDMRNMSFVHFFRIVSEVKPKFFLVENVPGIMQDIYDEIREQAFSYVSGKYHVLPEMHLSANEYGAATTRKRIFFFGYLTDELDPLTIDRFNSPSDVETVHVKDALCGLPSRIDPDWQKEDQSWRLLESTQTADSGKDSTATSHLESGTMRLFGGYRVGMRFRASWGLRTQLKYKYGVGLNHMPSARFAANGAWLAVQVMAHNLDRWTARIGLGERTVITKILRRRVFALVGRITRSARRLTLHLPRRWPWETQFSRALARLQAIPFPA